MIRDQIISEIDATIENIRRGNGFIEESARLYEKLGRSVVHLRGSSIAYRRSERKKGAAVRKFVEERYGK